MVSICNAKIYNGKPTFAKRRFDIKPHRDAQRNRDGLTTFVDLKPLDFLKTLILMIALSASLGVHICLMSLPSVWIFKAQTTNWQGQILSFLFFFLISLLLKKLHFESTSWTVSQKKFLIEGVAIGFVMAILSVLLTGGFQNINSVTERFLYQMTMPGISEEFIYRGFLLSLLNSHFGKKFFIWNTNFGWGIFLVGVPFVSAHLISFNGEINPSFIATGIFVLFGSLLLGFIRERSNSLLPAIVAHNTSNTIELAIVCFRRLTP